ncbi:hypothetical protein KKC34_09230 [bacterium]|nr:hypothetical protein [bacterium]
MYYFIMDFKSFETLLSDVGLNIQVFSEKTNTSVRTVQNWFTQRKGKVTNEPKWVVPYIELYKENKKQKHIIEYLEEKQNEKN